ncbi:hypothetical protein N8T08_006847 [Aspergillus melleus]|uniref:Uncharacterized protein n=1 Tax=Aspergillus melleus TaxID=138277 RepID=A0ACC3AZA9_9EURO|nr:hypothetical protein N8T08_006847 [Aspergillus melleus]
MAENPFYEHIYSEIVHLRSSDSERQFNVHKAVLESKCKVIHSALSKGFSEFKEGVYTCTDTTHDTLALAVEWMYTGSYTMAAHMPLEARTGQPVGTEQGVNPSNLSELAEEMKSDPIIAHLRLYTFSDLYLMTDLNILAYNRLAHHLANVDRTTKRGETQRAIIAMLHLAFSKIKPGDKFLNWLAHFASWNLEVLLSQTLFNDLLADVPALGSLMMTSLSPATSSPWGSRKAKRVKLHQGVD